MSGRPHRRGTAKESAEKKLSGRQCTFVYQKPEDDGNDGKRVRRCRNKTGENFFFCKQHLSQTEDFGMVGI